MHPLLDPDPGPVAPRVAIVGGGAAAVITAHHLLRSADRDHPVDVRLVERHPGFGRGLAYRTRDPLHTVNNYAGRLSAVDGDPDHLLRWAAERGHPLTPTSFPPRGLYGDYLEDVLDAIHVPGGSALLRGRGHAVDVTRHAGGLSVHLSRGWTVEADKVVLALGNPPPRRRPELERLGERYVADPWCPDLVDRLEGVPEVLLLGTGHTMVDTVAVLNAAFPMTRFTAVSRRGLLPSRHQRRTVRLHDAFHPGTGGLDEVLHRVAHRLEEVTEQGGDWRDVVDSVRASANDVWRGFSPADQDRFVRELARHWEVARHRMAPDLADLVDSLQHSGRLRVLSASAVDAAAYPAVVNCTGPAPVPTRGWNRLVDALLDRGTLRPHRLGLGVDCDEHGRVVSGAGEVDPDVYVVGAARKGVEWEVSAVPDLRTQAARLAEQLVRPASATQELGTAVAGAG
jgi:uncharacterized NAD(P)/FAD-binding protein YdhS